MFEKLKDFTAENTFFILDFDHTITQGDSASSYSLFRRSGLLGEEYFQKNTDLFSYYYPFEIDNTLSQKERGKLMFDWHYSSIELLKEFSFNIDIFNEVLEFHHLMKWREGFQNFFHVAHELSIPVIIFSAGIKQIIQTFFKHHNIVYDNIHFQSNTLIFDNDGKLLSMPKEGFIYPTEKTWDKLDSEIHKKLENRKKYILVGDMIDDITMAPIDESYTGFLIGIHNREEIDSKNMYEAIFDRVIHSQKSDCDTMREIILELKK